MTCKECSSEIRLSYGNLNTELETNQVCIDCYSWIENLKFDPKRVIINGNCYHIGSKSEQFKGYGGRRFKIQFLDGTLTETTNLWHNGIIPEHFLERFPDNAKFVG